MLIIWMRKVEGLVDGNTLGNISRTQEDNLVWTCLVRDAFYFKKFKRDTKNKMRNITQAGLTWPSGLAVNNCKEEAKLHQPKGLPSRLFSSSSSAESLALMWIRTELQAQQAGGHLEHSHCVTVTWPEPHNKSQFLIWNDISWNQECYANIQQDQCGGYILRSHTTDGKREWHTDY